MEVLDMNIKHKLVRFYAILFSKVAFRKFNRILVELGLRGLGVLNYYDFKVSGEKYALDFIVKQSKSSEDCIFLDIGANIGDYTRLIRESGHVGRVVCFEPNPNTYLNLTKSMGQDKDTILCNSAIGSSSGVLTLYDIKNRGGTTRASTIRSALREYSDNEIEKFDVPVIVIDEYFSDTDLKKIFFVKIDVEGYELNVIKGMLKLISLRELKYIQIEFNEMNISGRSFFRDFEDILSEYTPYRLLPDGGMLNIKSYPPHLKEIFAYQNVIFKLNQDNEK
jgi:FkbM family methyltransferase